MRKTYYKRICLSAAALCLILAAVCFAPLVGFATEASEQDTVHFINPTAITAVGDCLYVADNVEEGKTALLCFKVDGINTTLLWTTELNERINGLYGYTNGTKESEILYAVCGNKVMEIATSPDANNKPVTKKTYAVNGHDIVGFTKGRYNSGDVEFALTDRLLRYDSANDTFVNATQGVLPDTKGCVSLGDIVFYVYNNGGKFICGGYKSNSSFLDGSVEIATEPIGITVFGNSIAFFSKHSVMYVNTVTMENWTNNRPMQGNAIEYLVADTGDRTILDVAITGDVMFILNENINKIDVYSIADGTAAKTDNVIGSDVVEKEVPSSYDSFTLAHPNGYPANIVYKTTGKDSIEEIITDAKEYVILGYEGEENSHYYYVMIGDKFGWVKKSDNATSPATDNKITVINNNVSGSGLVETVGKFNSLNAVYVYELPLKNADYTTVTQTASSMKEVKLLQKFTEGEQIWYYVSYDDDKTGFVKEDVIGQIRNVAKTDDIKSMGDKKINSSLFAAVNLYATEDMSENSVVHDADGNVIKLYSGDWVTLVEEKGDVAFVMVLHSDGEKDFGWIESDRLINVHQITTNAIVGLVLLAVAIALATVLLIVYFKRKKIIKRNNG